MAQTKTQMRTATGLLHEALVENAGQLLVNQIRSRLGSDPVHLCVLFASAHFDEELPGICERVQAELGPRVFIGVTGEAVLCDGIEFEGQPALTLWAAHLPEVGLASFHIADEDLERVGDEESLVEMIGVKPDDKPMFLLFADPFSTDIAALLAAFEAEFPKRPVVGGLASAGEKPNQNLLIFDGQPLRNGAVGVALWGGVQLETLVSQGCRPIGRHYVITKCDGQVIYQLGGRAPLEVVHDLLHEIPARDRELIHGRGLLVGRVINEYQATFHSGDFLIRTAIGFDARSGALAIGDDVRVGQTIQFHVRDAVSASDDFANLLTAHAHKPVAGALLFSCNGRGTRFFSQRNHDAALLIEKWGKTPLAGFFCAGEIGPIGNQNHLHGHTAVVAIFRPAPA